MRTREAVLTLIAELEGDATEIERVLAHNREAWERVSAGASGPVDLGALAFTIHTIYGVLENYFLRISKFFENNLPANRWHRELVEKMTLDIPGLRPALITNVNEKSQVLDLVRFRHRVRNLYGEDLDVKKMRDVQKSLQGFFGAFPKLHGIYICKLKAIADEI